jgi:hypothetical protein
MGGITTEKRIKACTPLGRHVRIVMEEHPERAIAERVEQQLA